MPATSWSQLTRNFTLADLANSADMTRIYPDSSQFYPSNASTTTHRRHNPELIRDGLLVFKNRDGQDRGILDFSGPRIRFHGDIEESGKLLFDHLIFHFSTELRDAERKGYEQGHKDGYIKCTMDKPLTSPNPFIKKAWWNR